MYGHLICYRKIYPERDIERDEADAAAAVADADAGDSGDRFREMRASGVGDDSRRSSPASASRSR